MSLFNDPSSLDPEKLSPGGKGRAKGINALLIAWMDSAMTFLNRGNKRRAYERIFKLVADQNDERVFSYRYPNGMIGYIRNPAGLLVEETWSTHPDTRLQSFQAAWIFGYGSTPGSAFVQGKNRSTIGPQRRAGDRSVFVFFDLRRLENSGARGYIPDQYELDPYSGLLRRRRL